MAYRAAWAVPWGVAVTWSATLFTLYVGSSVSAVDIPYELRGHDVFVIAAFGILPPLLLVFAIAVHLYMLAATTRSAAVMPAESNDPVAELLSITSLGTRWLLFYRLLALCRYHLASYSLLASLYVGLAVYLAIERQRVRYFYFSSTQFRLVIQIEPISQFPTSSNSAFLWLPFIALLVCISSLIAACSFAVMSSTFPTRYRIMVNLGFRLTAVVFLIIVIPRLLQTLGITNGVVLGSPSVAGLSLVDGGLGIAAASISAGQTFLPWNAQPHIWFVYFPAALIAIFVVSVLIAAVAIQFTAWRSKGD